MFVALKLEKMENPSFESCEELEIVIVPKVEIRDFTFYNCKKLHTVLAASGIFECSCDACPMCKGVFEECL